MGLIQSMRDAGTLFGYVGFRVSNGPLASLIRHAQIRKHNGGDPVFEMKACPGSGSKTLIRQSLPLLFCYEIKHHQHQADVWNDLNFIESKVA